MSNGTDLSPPLPASVTSRLIKPFTPAVHAARNYSARKFRKDFIAGLTVAVVELPQAMAYALIAGVPPQYGIYTSIIQGILGALLSSSEHVTSGPTNTQSLLVAAAISRAVSVTTGVPVEGFYLQLVFALTSLKGIMQLAFWAGRFGDLVQFVSRSVVLGIATGAGVLIVTGQLASFLGIARGAESRFPGVIGDIERIWPALPQWNWLAVAIGLAVVLIIVVAKAVNRFIPGALIAIVLASACTAIFGWDQRIAVVGEIERALPTFNLPPLNWEVISLLMSGAIALALLGGIETISIAKTLASRSGERIDANQEFFAQGMKNFVSGFFQCIPGSASFTRSALDYDAGAETRFAAVMNAIFVGLLFFAFTDFAKFIPYPALAGVLFVVAWGLIEPRYFSRVWRADRSDAIVFAVTFISTIVLPLQYAVFVGIFLNIAFYLRVSSRLHIAQLVETNTGTFAERPIVNRSGETKIVFLQLEGDLFFALADQLRDQLNTIRTAGVRVIVLRLKHCHSIDATILHLLDEFASDMADTGGHLILCGLRPETMHVVLAYGLNKTIGSDNLFHAGDGTFTSAKRALARAQTLVGSSVDTSRFKMDDEGEISYDI